MCEKDKADLNNQSMAPNWTLDWPGLVARRKGPEDTLQGWCQLILLE